MQQFMRKFTQLNGEVATITLDHCWFGKQRFETQELKFICDSRRLGLVLRGQDVFILKEQLCEVELKDDAAMFADDKLKILIQLKK